jgi:hypothetical protein
MSSRDAAHVRDQMVQRGLPAEAMSDDDIRTAMHNLSLKNYGYTQYLQ